MLRALAVMLGVVSVTTLGAQVAQPGSGQAEPQAVPLPVTRVILYKSGVGYFEHVGTVTDSQRVAVPFTSGQLDDVLKSLTTIDLGNGRVVGVTYDSPTPMDRRLEALRLPLGQSATTIDFLAALRGARIEVRPAGATALTGRLLSVERRRRAVTSGTVETDELTLVTDRGEVVTVDLGGGTRVRVVDEELRDEVGRYLDVTGSSRDADARRMVIATAGEGARPFFVSYVSEAAVWKTSYRLVFPSEAGRKPMLQGWAIIDNSGGADWDNVELSLVAGAPQSFVQPLSQPLFARRPMVPMPTGLVPTPQRHDATLVEGSATDADAAGPRAAPEDAVSTNRSAARERAAGRGSGLESGGGVVGGMAGGVLRSVQPASAPPLAVSRDELEQQLLSYQAAASGADLGELFEYQLQDPVTIRRNESALVPILQTDVEAERVSLWNTAMGNRPRRAVWIKNAGTLTLDGGSISLVDAGAFAGEGLVDTVKPGERRLVSYASDLGVVVDSKPGSSSGRTLRIRVAKGVLIRESEDRERRTYTIRNQDRDRRAVVIEHPRRAGWDIRGTSTPEESTAGVHRFRVEVPSQETATLDVDEMRPGATSYALASLTDEQLTVIVERGSRRDALVRALQPLFDKRAELQRVDADILARQQEVAAITEDQARVRENMRVLERSSTERRLLERYTRQLDAQETRMEMLGDELARLKVARQTADRELGELIAGLTLDLTL